MKSSGRSAASRESGGQSTSLRSDVRRISRESSGQSAPLRSDVRKRLPAGTRCGIVVDPTASSPHHPLRKPLPLAPAAPCPLLEASCRWTHLAPA